MVPRPGERAGPAACTGIVHAAPTAPPAPVSNVVPAVPGGRRRATAGRSATLGAGA